jgi:hypothetical protein
MVVGLGGLFISNELMICFGDLSFDKKFGDEAREWNIGQIIAMALISGQIAELVSYIREKSIGSLSRFEVWSKSLRWKARTHHHEEGFSLIETPSLADARK